MVRPFVLSAAAAAMALNVAAVRAKADPIPTVIGVIAGLEFLWALADDTPQPDKDRGFLIGGAGYFDVIQRDDSAGEFLAEFRAPFQVWKFKPMVGVFGTTDKAVGGYIGIHHDLNITDNLVLGANIAPTFYASGDGKHLGSWAVLRSGLEISYRFENAMRISATFHHMSHGEIFDDKNPGVEDAAITFSVPLDAVFGK